MTSLSVFIAVFTAVFADRILGEPRRYHPLVGFGMLVKRLETCFLLQAQTAIQKKRNGLLACAIAVLPLPCILWLALYQLQPSYLLSLINIVTLYLVIGARSLEQHALQVIASLANTDIQLARQHVSGMVSRETHTLDEEGICKATIESVLENGSDAIIAPLFWFALAGAPGAVCYRLLNTLDAMWGYKNERYDDFGWAAAKLDDCVNWLPARLTACSYAIVGDLKLALQAWHQVGKKWDSPNAGIVMAAGAGALNLRLGGDEYYHGKLKQRPVLGTGKTAHVNDIKRSIHLINRTVLLWIVSLFILAWLR